MSTMIVTQAVYDAFRAHGEETYPHECCGALLGRPDAKGWRVLESDSEPGIREPIQPTTVTISLPLSWFAFKGVRGTRGLRLPGSITRIPTTLRNGRRPTSLKRIGLGVLT